MVTRYVWWPLTHIAQVVHPAPLLSGLVVFALLAFVGQMHEVYLVYLEPPYDVARGWHIALAAGALTLLSAALYFANYSLSDVTIDIVWSESRDVDRDSRLRLCRNIAGLLIAALPWAGVWYGVLSAGTVADRNIAEITKAAASLGGVVPETIAAIKTLAEALNGLYWTLLVIALSGFAVVCFLHFFRRNEWVRYAALGLIALLFLAAVVVPFMGNSENVQPGVRAFRAIGPLAMIILDLLLVFACVAVLTLLSREVGLPVVTLVVVIGLVAIFFALDAAGIAALIALPFLIVAALALLSWRWQLFVLSTVLVGLSVGFLLKRDGADDGEALSRPAQDLVKTYSEWLAEREDVLAAYKEARSGSRYPVFIIAAEGGGIYAAAAASAFLSRLQELCPSFAQHVFAISAVSGGAVGASVFQSVIWDEEVKTTGCDPLGDRIPGEISEKSSQAIRADHLSPLLGFMVADLLGIYDRASGLEQSLMSTNDVLGAPFDRGWWPDKAAPSLVLNATWVENGHRVAFAPFKLASTLERLGDKTLHSFRDDYFSDNRLRRMSLAGAAVVSARFPAVLPAFMIHHDKKRWNFVDGGYKDSSGALTALAIFNAIKAVRPEDVKPRLILLTSTQPEFDPGKIGGTSAPDMLAPAITLFSVRDRLAEDAVIRTITAVDGLDADNLPARSSRPPREMDDWNVKLVEINQQAFTLSSGWTISKSTYAIVSLQMGYPELCQNPNSEAKQDDKKKAEGETKEETAEEEKKVTEKGQKKNVYLSVPTLEKNSCVVRSVVELLRTKPAK